MKNIIITALLSMVIIITVASCGSAKNTVTNTDSVALTQAVDSGSWVFTVSTVIPQGGRTRQPNGFYTVSYSTQNLNVYLPYFGRAYSGADVFGADNPLNFVSKDFSIEKEILNDDKWRIVFKPADQRQVQSMGFEIFKNGSASLDVIMTNRSPISYRGNVTVKK